MNNEQLLKLAGLIKVAMIAAAEVRGIDLQALEADLKKTAADDDDNGRKHHGGGGGGLHGLLPLGLLYGGVKGAIHAPQIAAAGAMTAGGMSSLPAAALVNSLENEDKELGVIDQEKARIQKAIQDLQLKYQTLLEPTPEEKKQVPPQVGPTSLV